MARGLEPTGREEMLLNSRSTPVKPTSRPVSNPGKTVNPATLRPAAQPPTPPTEMGRIRDLHPEGRSGSSHRWPPISIDERQTMIDLGRFRTIAASDLAGLKYGGRERQMQQDLRSLIGQGLVERKSIWTGRNNEKQTFFSLTKAGKSLLKSHSAVGPDQAIYAGFVKPAELRHDAAIYPMYHREAARIAREGGQITRIVLDYELKKKAYPALAKARALPPQEYEKRHSEIARDHDLKIVNGHIVLPDLRIEFRSQSGASAHVDLEVASESYHGSHAAEKAAAGFRIYAAGDTASRLSSALEEREITAEIFRL